MKTYTVAVTRTYLVSINAEDEDQAQRFAEYYLGDSSDLSTEKERREKNFSIENIEMIYNEAQKGY